MKGDRCWKNNIGDLFLTSDPYTFSLICFPLAAIIGYIGGYATVRINHLLVIITGKVWTSGRARKRYNLIIAYASIIYLIAVSAFLFAGEHLAIKIISVSIFLAAFILGIKHAESRYNQALPIMDKIIGTMFLSPPYRHRVTYPESLTPREEEDDDDTQPKLFESVSNNFDLKGMDKKEEDVSIKDATRIARNILNIMPKSNVEALKVLFMFFDSKTGVFLISLSAGKWRLKRFSNLSMQDRHDYLSIWANNQFLFYAIQGMKSLVNFSYYNSAYSWNAIGYNGNFLRWSYIR